MPTDSTGNPIHVGDCVRWRGEEYTIADFIPEFGRAGVAAIVFVEPLHTEGTPDEISVDLVKK